MACRSRVVRIDDTLANNNASEDRESRDISEVLKRQATQLLAQVRQFTQNANHENAAFDVQEILRRFRTTQLASKTQHTLIKSGINR